MIPNLFPHFFFVVVGKNKILNMKNPKDLETTKNMLLCVSDEEEDIILDEEERICKREDYSVRMSATIISEDEDSDDRYAYAYIVHLRKDRNIID
ncbi:hypothetical protein NPIL_375171 [Nephila pilipes]|uniref:Uncharacterized protein n=1 Tax=Nephila pilipes TaxID=299642 RepID=A0A8X6URD7_NEPPI|nr:hypothetical protein NPIL_375171 [Nephila pilipes]